MAAEKRLLLGSTDGKEIFCGCIAGTDKTQGKEPFGLPTLRISDCESH